MQKGEILHSNTRYIVRKANPSGGKAGAGKNKTSTIQVLYNNVKIRQWRYNTSDYGSYLKAKKDAIEWATKNENVKNP